jgi:uncharacterized protein (DUF305 family)
MTYQLRIRPAAVLLAVVVSSACARTSVAAPEPVPAPAPAAPPLEQPRDVRTSPQAIADARADSARVPYTATDVRFMTDMIGHHAQAIRMARMAPTHGAGPSVRTLAARIINAQLDEIFNMQQWLADREKPWPHVDAQGNVHGTAGHEAHHASMMAGMLTEEQLRQLDAARGAEFDRLFLTFMIQHHRGAVAMVRELLSSAGAAHNDTVFRLAGDINVDQTTEIARMEGMLAELKSTQRNN